MKRTGLRPSPDVMARRLGDEMILVHLKRNRMFSLNRIGARVWELLEATEGDPVVVRSWLLEEFSVSQEELEVDLEALIGDLLREEMLTLEESR